MKNNNRMPKREYFQMRMEQAIANGLESKAEYYRSRLAQMDDKPTPRVEKVIKPNYSELVRKCVGVLNAPKGTVNAKQAYLTQKLAEEGCTKQEANTIFLEALNIASNGELLASV